MADEIVEIAGLSSLNDFLQQLPAKVEQNIMRSAMRKGQNVIKKAAARQLESNGSIKTGALKKSIKVSVSARYGKIKATVKAGDSTAFYAHMVEFGHFSRGKGQGLKGGFRSKKAQRAALKASGAKFVAPKPFMRPAFDSNSITAINTVAEAIRARLEREGIAAFNQPGAEE
ncbi:MAG: HK97-gp10 family putative phage morphogenesis protein [Azonexus sp.]